MSTRQYARIVDRWVSSIGLDPTTYGTLSMRRTKAGRGRATLIGDPYLQAQVN